MLSSDINILTEDEETPKPRSRQVSRYSKAKQPYVNKEPKAPKPVSKHGKAKYVATAKNSGEWIGLSHHPWHSLESVKPVVSPSDVSMSDGEPKPRSKCKGLEANQVGEAGTEGKATFTPGDTKLIEEIALSDVEIDELERNGEHSFLSCCRYPSSHDIQLRSKDSNPDQARQEKWWVK
jgi:hypothetical protein